MRRRLIMVGECPRCGRRYTRSYPVDTAVCLCAVKEAEKLGKNPLPAPIIVQLEPVLVLPKAQRAKFQRLSELTGVSVERLVNASFEEALKQKLKEAQPFPQLTVTTKKCKIIEVNKQ